MLDRVFNRIGFFTVPLICCMLIGYFAYHAFYGGNGIIAAERLEARIAILEGDLARSIAIRKNLKNKVALLRPESIDPDMVDEYARSLLGKAHKNDVVILRPHTSQ